MANYLYGLPGGTPESSLRAESVWLYLLRMLSLGNPRRFARNEILQNKSIALSYGHDPSKLPIGVHSWVM